MSKEEVEILDAEVMDEITNPDFSNTDIYTGPAKSIGKRKKDFSTFTPANREKILQATSVGSPPSYAAKLAGIVPNTLTNWIERGRIAQGRIDDGYEDELSEVEKDFANFFTEYNRVASTVVTSLLANILQKARDKPYLALKLLEKLDPAQFGARQLVDMNVAGRVGVGHIHVNARQLADGGEIAKQLSTDELRMLRADLVRKKARKALQSGEDSE